MKVEPSYYSLPYLEPCLKYSLGYIYLYENTFSISTLEVGKCILKNSSNKDLLREHSKNNVFLRF